MFQLISIKPVMFQLPPTISCFLRPLIIVSSCASEQAVIIDKEISDEFRKILQDNNCYFVKGKELEQLSEFCFPKEKCYTLNGTIVGQSAEWIAQQAGFEVPKGNENSSSSH